MNRHNRGRRAELISWVFFTLVAVVAPRTSVAAFDPIDSEFAPIRKILEQRCGKCHARGQKKGGFSIETRGKLIEGGDSGPAVVVGKSRESLLIELVSGEDPARVMPATGERLTEGEIALLARWIDRGVHWPAEFTFGFPRAPVEPRRPEIPPADPARNLIHPIDRLIAAHDDQVDWQPVVSDRQFARRVYLDLTGLLPSPEQLAAFERDSRSEKRTQLVAQLLADDQAYAEHWLTFWNDALRNAYSGTGYIDGGRLQITEWLYRSLYENKPYDRFVHELVSPVPGSEGFSKGIVWRGVVNASQVPAMQAAQNVSQVFLGTNLKCASCHDSFVNDWKLKDAYALAGVFADGPLEMHRCDKPTGETVPPGFIFPQLGQIDGRAPRAERQRQLADIITSPDNGRFARTIVNRMWAWFFGRGLVEPVDDMDQPAWNRDLLDWLAVSFVDQSYDLKHLIATIVHSRAYQLRSVGATEHEDGLAFRGPLVKRMSGEQFIDAVSAVTGYRRAVTPTMLDRDGRGQGGQLRASLAVRGSSPNMDAKWIWSHADAARSDPGGRIYLRKTVELTEKPSRAPAVLTADNAFVLYVNGKKVAASDAWQNPTVVDLARWLTPGPNTIALEAINWPDEESKKGLELVGKSNPAGLIFAAVLYSSHVEKGTNSPTAIGAIESDASWLVAPTRSAGWEQPDFDTTGWKHAVEIADAAGGPWMIAPKFAAALRMPDANELIRAALAHDDPLLRALGRSNREQVVTRRDSIATTLQALELTNGITLDQMLRSGAENWLRRAGADPRGLIEQVYLHALGRQPTDPEFEAALEIVGETPSTDRLQDLLWAVTMLPEFQLIF